MKKIIAWVIAIILAVITVKLAWWLLTSIFYIAFNLITILLVAVVAVPIYLIIRRKLLR